ncbi:unannotated protein [freshwater metagenome]|uniref:Unannotated protein n=1 Tax=freshwater metagenome TaxID=449393 RepID=A0A6J6VAE4_9ZZZZ
MLIITKVLLAFTCSGSLNNATPSEIASNPVKDEPPFANALSNINIAAKVNRPCSWPISTAPGWFTSRTGRDPVIWRYIPIEKTIAIDPTKRYVGNAKALPASLTPLKFP